MKMNMKKHLTSNIQHPTLNGTRAARARVVGVQASACPSSKLKLELQRACHWMLDVGCWMLDVTRFRLRCGILVLLASAAFAFAQSNGVPGPADYTKFSSFVTDRNIFDPARVPHS